MVKLALITGASSGIGEALAIEMARRHYKVILVARSEDRLKLISDRIQNEGGESIFLRVDLENGDEVASLKGSIESYGELSVIINNAGYGNFNNIENTEIEDWDRHININLRASFLICKIFVPQMKKRGAGVLVFINSVAGKKGYSNSTAYVASKFGLVKSNLRDLLEAGTSLELLLPLL